ncbi:unnamed protein product [Schistocephalus solidus]|uniref:Uncharacterized protein n=1 Tax=Schistocephalus solidus TaxID=70667 RepID=A0A183SM94_SCHSO|nr:unnamed protein product [Schistocephalus solidus]
MGSFLPEVQHILALASGSFNTTQLYQMAERLMKMPDIAKPQRATLSTSPVLSVSPLSHLKAELAQLAEQVASLQEPTSSSSWSPPLSTARPIQSLSFRPTSAATCWYHIIFDIKALRCIAPCFFVSQQRKRLKQVSLRVNMINITEFSSPCHTFYVCDSSSGRRFPVDAGVN